EGRRGADLRPLIALPVEVAIDADDAAVAGVDQQQVVIVPHVAVVVAGRPRQAVAAVGVDVIARAPVVAGHHHAVVEAAIAERGVPVAAAIVVAVVVAPALPVLATVVAIRLAPVALVVAIVLAPFALIVAIVLSP